MRTLSVIFPPEFPGDALPFFGTQGGVIPDIPGFLILEALEDFYDPAEPLHESIIS
jgi:hypothetical protein